MHPIEVAGHVALGVAIGFFGGLFGISGGIIAIPSLGVLGLAQQLAQGTSLVGQLPSSLTGFFAYRRRSALDPRYALVLGLSATPGALAGAFTAHAISSGSLRRAFAAFIITIATYTLYNALSQRRVPAPARVLSWPLAAAIGVLAGFFSGVFGIGGAAFAIPTFTAFFGMSQTEAQGLGLVVVLPSIFLSVIVYAAAGSVDWTIGIPLAIGSAALVSAGVAVAHRLPDLVLRLAFVAVMYAGATALWFRG